MIRPGRNIAIKTPLFKWPDTVAFYRDKVGLKVGAEFERSVMFRFGEVNLWIDAVAHQSQADVWLELFSDDPEGDRQAIAAPLRNELEPLGDVGGLWTSDPAGVVLLLRRDTGTEGV